MRIRFFLIITSMMITQALFAITVNGNAYLEAQTDHSGINVFFERLAPDSLSYTTYTDTTGYYTVDIETGLYNITYSKYGYLDYNTFENLYSDTTLPDIILIEHQSLINVPSDFDSIQVAIDYSCWGDTILVQPGIYYENLYLNNDQLTIGSLYLTTQDTSYISQTIIDGGNNDSVVKFYNGPDVLVGFSIRNGNAPEFGGGIRCHNADTVLSSLIISNNTAVDDGGGVYCFRSSPIIENTIISFNNADLGGGIYCEEVSSPHIINTLITSNTSRYGAGFYCLNPSEPILNNVLFTNNTTETNGLGGGMYLGWYTTPNLTNVVIKNNTATWGAGIFSCFHANPYLTSVDIYNNTATSGGAGICCANNGTIQFDDQNRCNLYSNQILYNRGYGADISLNSGESFEVIIDTFSVLTPTDYYASPIDNLTFDILHSVQDSLINQDVYVSVVGDNSNIGTSPDEAFKTIRYAFSRIHADSLNSSNTIHILPGTYSSTTNGEIYPIRCSSYVTIKGSLMSEVVLDAENETGVISCNYTNDLIIKNLTIKNGSVTEFAALGGGLYCRNSYLTLENVKISSNFAEGNGGAIYCADSELVLRNVEISENDYNENVIYSINSSIDFINVSFVDNTSSIPILYSFGYSYLSFTNCILWDNITTQIYCNNNGQENELTFSYTDILYGQNGINYNSSVTNLNWLEGNINDNPLFLGSGDYPFSLQDLSPCINTGIPDTTGLNLPEYDLAGNPRIYGERIEMGAYENQNVYVNSDENFIQPVLKLHQNHPNPFNPTTTISFSIPEESKVELSIYNIKGQKIKTLSNKQYSEGEHSVIWDGKDSNSRNVASGLYLYKLRINGETEIVKKCMLLK